jgi:2-dehydro-3-deoxyphosphogluconate aldolase / (4S)-4-hydroxy-2-oxoglutarate aldolase
MQLARNMRSRPQIISLLTHPGIIAVVRTDRADQVPLICEALLAGGVIALEITLTVPNALGVIREASRRFGSQALIGAGTVLNAGDCRNAIEAGAEFIVSPIGKLEIVEAAQAADKPAMLGAYTPTEAQAAHEGGADFVKIFPADKLGPAYIRALRAPLPHLRIVPTGGVDLNTATEFLKAGCAALGVGGSLLTAAILKNDDWAELTRLARAYVEIAANAQKR